MKACSAHARYMGAAVEASKAICPDCKALNTSSDPVNHPKHYTSHPSGVECITVTEHYGFNVGNAIKYLWRAGLKNESPLEDLKKAAWYINREIERLAKGQP